MSIEYRTGFSNIKPINFRPDIIRKGKELEKAGHIFNVSEVHKNGQVAITGYCVRQGSITSSPYLIELQLDHGRNVVGAHCICQAGIDGQCKHSSALVRNLI